MSLVIRAADLRAWSAPLAYAKTQDRSALGSLRG
jgi:hypothetical protein